MSPTAIQSPQDAPAQPRAPAAPWVRLVVGYLLITGLFHWLRFVIDWSIFSNNVQPNSGGGFRGFDDLAWVGATRFVIARFPDIAAVPAALLVLRKPAYANAVVLTGSLILLVVTMLSAISSIGIFTAPPTRFSSNNWITSGIYVAGRVAISVFLIRFVLRVDALARPHIRLLWGCLLIVGLQSLSVGATILAEGSFSWVISSTLDSGFTALTAAALAQLLYLVFGGFWVAAAWKLKRRPPLLGPAILLYTIGAIVFSLQIVLGLALVAEMFQSAIHYLRLFCMPAAHIVFGIFLFRFARNSGVEREGRCTECGYNLTGNTSGACPECGTATAVFQE